MPESTPKVNGLSRSLDDRAKQINEAHEACLASAGDTIERAIDVGRLLTETKGAKNRHGSLEIPHGQWESWVEKNIKFGIDMACKYLHAYKKREGIRAQIRNRITDFPTNAWRALDNLATPRPIPAAGPLDTAKSFFCPACGEMFDREVWHCPGCAHHWLPTDGECRNCHGFEVDPGGVVHRIEAEEVDPDAEDLEERPDSERWEDHVDGKADDLKWDRAAVKWTELMQHFSVINESLRRRGGVRVLTSRWSRRNTEGFVEAIGRVVGVFQSILEELEGSLDESSESGA